MNQKAEVMENRLTLIGATWYLLELGVIAFSIQRVPPAFALLLVGWLFYAAFSHIVEFKKDRKHTDKQEKRTMKINHHLIAFLLLAALLLSGCGSKLRVGELRTESQSVELGGAKSVDVDINMGAGDLEVTGGAEKLLEADFTYNVDKLKPAVQYTDGTLVLRQPENEGLPDLRGVSEFRNEWGLRLNDEIPMDLRVKMGAGTSDLQLAGLSLTGLHITLGAGGSTIDLTGDWTHNLNITIDAGAADLSVRLPRDVGVRVEVDGGADMIEAPRLTQSGNLYTNAAYVVSKVALQVDIKAGIGRINLELVDN